MTASSEADLNAPTTASAAEENNSASAVRAGFRSVQKNAAPEAAAPEEPAPVENAGLRAGLVSKKRNAQPSAQGPAVAAPLHTQFNHADFLAMLAKLYEVPEIAADKAAPLEGFTLDPDKDSNSVATGTLFARFGAAPVEITKESVLTDAPMTPELAYKMAAVAAANPKAGALVLEGTDDEKVMLFLAAQHLGLKIDEASIPVKPQNIDALAASFHEFEKAKGLRPIAGDYLQPQATAHKQAPAQPSAQAQPQKPRPQPTAPQSAFAPV